MVFSMASVFAQQQGGSIVLTNFGDSTYVNGVAGEFNYTEFDAGHTLNIKGMYGDVATAVELNVNYSIFATDWSSILYIDIDTFANTAMGNMDGIIDGDYTFPLDADVFGDHDILDPVTDSLITAAPTFLQVRVWHDVLPVNGGPDVFWYEFVRLYPEGTLGIVDFDRLEGVKVFPNPASNEITINTKEDLETNVMVYDITGRRVINTTLKGNRLDVSNLQSGYHTIRVEQNGKMAILNIMIE